MKSGAVFLSLNSRKFALDNGFLERALDDKGKKTATIP
jgi:hypothetical protein